MANFIAHIFSWLVTSFFALTNKTNYVPKTCSTFKNIEYCYFEGDAGSKKVIYFLHGFGNDRTSWSWNKTTNKVMQEFLNIGGVLPNVIAPSFNGYWWYNKKSYGVELREFADWAEKNLVKNQISERILYGDSMGGHNSLRWAADYPNFFHKLALSCPAVPSRFYENEFTPPPHNLISFLANQLISFSYANNEAATWMTEISKLLPRKIHISAATKDMFLFDTGNKLLYSYLKSSKQNYDLSYSEDPVIHCNIKPETMARFIYD